MNKIDEPTPKRRWSKWKGRCIAVLLVIAGIMHALKPSLLGLDWPSIALILVGVLLLFIPLEDVGTVIESLEVGKTKILFRAVKQLDDNVEQAIIENIAPMALPQITRQRTTALDVSNSDNQEGAEDLFHMKDRSNLENAPIKRTEGNNFGHLSSMGKTGDWQSVDLFEDPKIRFLLETDKEMALIRIGIEIERLLAELDRGSGVTSSGIVWSRTLRSLVQQEKISPQIATALTQFRNVRNQLIHPSGGPVPQSLVTSAVDSGVKLLQILSNIKNATT